MNFLWSRFGTKAFTRGTKAFTRGTKAITRGTSFLYGKVLKSLMKRSCEDLFAVESVFAMKLVYCGELCVPVRPVCHG